MLLTILLTAKQGHVLFAADRADDFNVEKTLEKIKTDLHPGQLAFVEDESTEIIGLSAGYGAGKTRALCAKTVHLAMSNQGFIGCVMGDPFFCDKWVC